VACERCGAPRASDAAILEAVFTAPNGAPLKLKLIVNPQPMIIGGVAPMFCDNCYLFFVEMFGQVRAAMRLIDGQTPIA